MACAGDGWHKVGNLKVLVQNRVITYCYKFGRNGDLIATRIVRWNKDERRYAPVGYVTLASLRAGLSRGTMTVR